MCKVEGCDSKFYAKGYCRLHYRHINEGKHDPIVVHKNCLNCGEKLIGRARKTGLCQLCYYKKWAKEHKQILLEYKKEYYKNNKDRCKRNNLRWKVNNPDRLKELSRKRMEKIENKIAHRLRNSLRDTLKGRQKGGSAVDFLGCSLSEFKSYIESKFQPGMTWDNWGVVRGTDIQKWHMDHIVPISKFDLTKPDEMSRACHYTNFQPLWGLDNMSKGARYEG